jgi:hypothetical protein
VPPPGPPYYQGQPPYPQAQNPYAQQQPQQENPYAQQQPQRENPYAQQQPQRENPYAQQQDPYAPPQPQQPYAAPGPYGSPYQAQQPQPFGYGAPGGPPPYPGQVGWYAQEKTTNGMSIAALVVGLVPCIPFLGAIFGLVALKQVKRSGERGKGMAVAGLTLSSVWTLGLAAIITLAAVGVFEEGDTPVTDIKAGQCFNTVGKKLSDYGDDKDARSTSVNVVDCAEAHDAEAFAVYEIQSGSDDPYPGVDAVTEDAQTNCSKYARTYLDGKAPSASTRLYFYVPPAEGWAGHQRAVICFLGSPSGQVTGSLKSGGGHTQGSGVGV